MPRIGRVLDAVAMVVFLSGAGLFVWAWVGFHEVRELVPDPLDGPWAAVRVADGYWRLQKSGYALMAAGIAGFVTAWWTARRALREAESESGNDGAPGPG